MGNELIPIDRREHTAISRWVWVLGCAAIAVATSELLSDYSIAWKMLAAGTAGAILFGVVDAVSRKRPS